jgi:hypothetical protein
MGQAEADHSRYNLGAKGVAIAMRKAYVWLGVVVGLAGVLPGTGQSPAQSAGQQTAASSGSGSATASANVPTVKVGSAVAAKAASPTPSATAKNQSTQASIGKGQALVKASAPSAYWTDLVDIDDDGVVEDNQFLFDNKRGVLYTYRYDDFKCANGTPENGDVLMAIYTKGNQFGMPVGAGWYVVGLNPGQCGEKKGGTFGCKFDAQGNFRVCGPAVIHNDSGELEVVVRKKG